MSAFEIPHFSWHYPSTGWGTDKESSGWNNNSGKSCWLFISFEGEFFQWKSFVWKTPAHCNGKGP